MYELLQPSSLCVTSVTLEITVSHRAKYLVHIKKVREFLQGNLTAYVCLTLAINSDDCCAPTNCTFGWTAQHLSQIQSSLLSVPMPESLHRLIIAILNILSPKTNLGVMETYTDSNATGK